MDIFAIDFSDEGEGSRASLLLSPQPAAQVLTAIYLHFIMINEYLPFWV